LNEALVRRAECRYDTCKLSPLQIPLAPALEAVGIYRQIPIRFVDVELEESLKIVGVLGIYAYDAYLIRCALKYRSPLISLDGSLIESAKQMKAEVIEVAR
jgi:predicted nucleic acid-binding protein